MQHIVAQPTRVANSREQRQIAAISSHTKAFVSIMEFGLETSC